MRANANRRFLWRAALALGQDPRSIERWPARLFREFQIYETLEPFGASRDNWHAAVIAQILTAGLMDTKQRRPKVSDFMFKDEQTRAEEREAETVAFFNALKAGGNGKQ